MITGLVDRFGRTGFALLSSLIWALPMAAWAGSFDLSPIDKTAYPRIALTIGLVMLAVWLFLLTRISKVAVSSSRPHRIDFARMTGSERGWSVALAAFVTGLIAWLNAAATVDWAPLVSGVSAGKVGPVVFAFFLAAFLVAVVVGIWISWKRAAAAFRVRAAARR